jgi:threonine dehydrogenase-like Zn-dependent dehydrogenase
MQQVRIHGPGLVQVDDVDPPEPTDRDVLIRVAACGVCGSDLKYIEMGGVAGPSRHPMALGHELAGTVEFVGAEVDDVAVGDRVVVHPGNDDVGRIGNGATEGGLTPLLLVRDAASVPRLHPIPDDMDLDIAALAEPLAVGMRAVDQADVHPGDSAAVMGCGPIGLAAIATMADRGITDVVAVEPSAARRDLAVAMGASAAIDPTTEDVWARLAEVHGTVPAMFGPSPATVGFIEASGVASVITDVIERCRPEARLSIVALHYAPIPTSYLLVLMKQLTIRGSMEYPPRFADAIDLLARRDLSALITHRVPLADFDRALGLLVGSKDCGKVLVTM